MNLADERRLVVVNAVAKAQGLKIEEIDMHEIKRRLGLDKIESPLQTAVYTAADKGLLSRKRSSGMMTLYTVTTAGRKLMKAQEKLLPKIKLDKLFVPKKSIRQQGTTEKRYSAQAHSAISGIADLIEENDAMRALLTSIHSQIGKVIAPQPNHETETEE